MLQPNKNKGVAKGNPPATRQDSLNVYNQSKKVEKFYVDEGYEVDKELNRDNGNNQLWANDLVYASYKGKGKKLSYGMFEDDKVSKEEYRKTIDKNKYYQRESADQWLNTNAPMQMYDKRIQPKGSISYINGNDYVSIANYNNIANKPFDLLTPKEKEQRVAKYGRAGVPDSYQSSIIKKPNTTTGNKVKEKGNKGMVLGETLIPKSKFPIKAKGNPPRPKVQGLSTNITPAGLIENKQTSLTTSELKVKPKFNPNQTYDVQEENVRMNDTPGYGSDRDKPNATAIQAVRAKENADKYNADIERRYNNPIAKKNPKAQERYKTLRNNVTITPNVPKFAYGGTIKNNNTMKRLPANKRHIAPTLIPTALSALSAGAGMFSSMSAAKEAQRAKRQQLQQAYSDKVVGDAQYMDDYDVNGDIGSDYFAKGGQLSPSSIKGNLDATGGDLIPLNSTTEKAEGNTHGENTIDGEYGITLNNGEEDIAEIEDKEVIVDNEMVFSDRLKYNKGVTYAAKAEQIAKKAGKLESRLNDSTDKRERNGIERQLAGTNMANKALFAHQEETQIKEGKVELDKLAYGGRTKLPFSPYLTEEADKLGNIAEGMEGVHNVPTPTLPAPTVAPIDDIKDPSLFQDLAPSLIDNLGNLALTAMSPKLPKPVGKIAPRMETRVNVNPQLSAIENTDNTIADTILSNTNNSAVARSGVAASRLRGRNAKMGILAEKENAEMNLRNQRNQQVSNVNNANIDTNNQYANAQFTRQGDIQSRLSGNLADLSEDIKDTRENRTRASMDEQILMLDLLNDPTGVKSKMMERNNYYKGSRKFRDSLRTEKERRNKATKP